MKKKVTKKMTVLEHEKLKAEVSQASKRLAEIQSQNSRVGEEVVELENKLADKVESYNNSMNKVTAMEKREANLSDALDSIVAETEGLKTKRSSLLTEITNYKKELISLEETIMKLRKEKETLYDENSSRLQELDKREKAVRGDEFSVGEYYKELERKAALIRKKEKLLNFEEKLKEHGRPTRQNKCSRR